MLTLYNKMSSRLFTYVFGVASGVWFQQNYDLPSVGEQVGKATVWFREKEEELRKGEQKRRRERENKRKNK